MNARSWDEVLIDIAKILNTQVIERLETTVEGTYKSRMISVKYFHNRANGSGGGGDKIEFRMLPLKLPREQKRFMINYPKPTKHTHIKGGVIYFEFPAFWGCDEYSGVWDEPEIIKAFDEMSQAADIVERDLQFYKGEMGELRSSLDAGVRGLEESALAIRKHDTKNAITWLGVAILCAICAFLLVGTFFLPGFWEKIFGMLLSSG